MIDGRTIVTRQPAPGLQQGPLAEGLGVGVGVRPAESLGPRLAGGDEAVLDPLLAESFGPGGEQGGAGRAELLAGLALETGQHLGVPAAGVGVTAGPPGGLDLRPPGHLGRPRGVREGGLGRPAPPAAGHVGGRDGDEMGEGAGRVQAVEGGGHPDRPEQVDLHRRVEGRVEAHGGGRVDHDRAGGQQLFAGAVQAEPVDADVAGHDVDPAVHLGREAVPELGAEPVEAVVPEDLAAHPVGRAPPSRADQQGHLAIRDGPQQALGEGGAEEAGRAGDGDAPAASSASRSIVIVYHLVSGSGNGGRTKA